MTFIHRNELRRDIWGIWVEDNVNEQTTLYKWLKPKNPAK